MVCPAFALGYTLLGSMALGIACLVFSMIFLAAASKMFGWGLSVGCIVALVVVIAFSRIHLRFVSWSLSFWLMDCWRNHSSTADSWNCHSLCYSKHGWKRSRINIEGLCIYSQSLAWLRVVESSINDTLSKYSANALKALNIGRDPVLDLPWISFSSCKPTRRTHRRHRAQKITSTHAIKFWRISDKWWHELRGSTMKFWSSALEFR